MTAEEGASGFTEHHEYHCLGLPRWAEAEECLESEAEVLERAASPDALDGVEEFLDETRETDDLGYFDLMCVLQGNDVGVAGLSLLSAQPGQPPSIHALAGSTTAITLTTRWWGSPLTRSAAH
ncbi:hypothetical protein [Streptomyces sp. AA1529]|uniref:hypothetical protein n=1 Tax=Streptomyces sp. AA1529 TaxID=1203257 RepID=UPI003D7378FF